jgi:putative ABC transport system permease protein
MHSLHQAITPLYIFLDTSNARYISIKIQGFNIPSVLTFIEKTFQQFSPGYPFEYSFFDDVFNKAYHAEQRLARLFSTFAFLTIFIACLGLFGLASYTTAARTKEIGIRKVLGASSAHITTLISREYIVKVMLAILISWPLGYYAMHRWLQNFAYRVELGIIPFVAAGFSALFIALLTVACHTLRAAAANPADTIRYE